MSGLVFACIAPHGSMIVPLLNEEGWQKALATRTAMEELGRRMAAARPETIVLVTPHGHRVDGVFSLLNNERVRGELGPEKDETGNGFSLMFEVDKELNAAIVAAARSQEAPVSRIGYAVADDPDFFQPLDWGATVPLWFLGGFFQPRPKVVIACPDRGNMSWELFAPFGRAVRLAAESIERRIAFIASADMGHAHDRSGPYGFDPASAEFDAAVIEAIQAQEPGRLLNFDQPWLKRASTDAYGQILNLHGAIQETNFRGELLSYEVPTYFGMMCVAYEASKVAPSSSSGV
ncbi:MAG: extradiol dioxygenase [Ktedonobacteraceae bacterium]